MSETNNMLKNQHKNVSVVEYRATSRLDSVIIGYDLAMVAKK
jgi:hypothetical protein